jgi:hypothetical protein
MELAHTNNQRKDEVKHSDAMLMKCDEEIMLLEKLLLRGSESKQETTTKEEKCSRIPSHEDVFTTFEEVEVNFNLQINYEDACIESKDEHEIVIKEIEAKLFLRNEIKPQVEHLDLMFENFEDEMGFLEKWIARDIGDENYKKKIRLN